MWLLLLYLGKTGMTCLKSDLLKVHKTELNKTQKYLFTHLRVFFKNHHKTAILLLKECFYM